MTIVRKYPQLFKKQHNKRCQTYTPNTTPLQYKTVSTASNVIGVFIRQRVLLPNKYISYIRKILRKFFKKQLIKCWFRVQLNKTISSKSKNSRMGKGVGAINRMGFLYNPQKPLLILQNISSRRAFLLVCMLQARLGVNVYRRIL